MSTPAPRCWRWWRWSWCWPSPTCRWATTWPGCSAASGTCASSGRSTGWCRVDPDAEQRWATYAVSVLAFSAVCVLFLYGLERLQGVLPLVARAAPG